MFHWKSHIVVIARGSRGREQNGLTGEKKVKGDGRKYADGRGDPRVPRRAGVDRQQRRRRRWRRRQRERDGPRLFHTSLYRARSQ